MVFPVPRTSEEDMMSSSSRRSVDCVICSVILTACLAIPAVGQERTAEPTASPRTGMVGVYGPWLADKVLGDGPGRMSFRTDKWKSADAWREAGRERVLECMAPVELGGVPEVRIDSTHEFDGLHIEHLSWQLPNGPRT